MNVTSTEHPAEALCRRLAIRLPVLQGGMTFGSDARLVVAVSKAGGLGTLGTFHYRTHDKIAEQLAIIRRDLSSEPFSVNVPFFERSFDLVQSLARQAGVKVFTLGGWFSEDMAKLKAELGLTVLVSVNSPTIARMVVERPLDALIVQGNESGGANSHFTTQQLFDLISPTTKAPVLLAGGQWDGADLHRALLQGAAGIQLGTRFFFSDESPLHPSIKQKTLDANSKRPWTTQLVPVSDTLSMRFVTNKAFKTALDAGEVQRIFQDKEKVFDLSKAFFETQDKPVLTYSGTGIYKLKAIEPCKTIVDSIGAEYRALCARKLPTFDR